jgi:hypothetical protein
MGSLEQKLDTGNKPVRVKHGIRLADDAHDLKEDSESLPLAERFGCSLLMDDPSLGSECFR